MSRLAQLLRTARESRGWSLEAIAMVRGGRAAERAAASIAAASEAPPPVQPVRTTT